MPGLRRRIEPAPYLARFSVTNPGTCEVGVLPWPFVTAGESRPTTQEIHWLRPDVALVVTTVERVGQQAPDGTPLGTRQTTHHRVLVRDGDGWRIASHLISDARDRRQASH